MINGFFYIFLILGLHIIQNIIISGDHFFYPFYIFFFFQNLRIKAWFCASSDVLV